jgi:membrane-associated phospholipid phosphatase
MKRIATFLAYLLHPVFAPLISVFLLFQLPIYLNYKYSDIFFNYIYVMLFLNLVAAPVLINFYLKRKKYIQSMAMENVSERVIPYLVSSMFYTLTYFLLKQIDFPEFYLEVFQWACITIASLLILAVFNQKVSAHMAGLGGICGMLVSTSFFYNIDNTDLLIIFLLLSGLAGFSRLALNAHSPIQLLSGFLLGFGLQLLSIF